MAARCCPTRGSQFGVRGSGGWVVGWGMREDSRPDHALIARVFAARATPAESAALEQWVGDDSGRQAEIERLRLVWSVVGDLPVPRRSAAAWARVAPLLQRGSARPEAVGGAATVAQTRRAASLLAAFALGVAIAVGGTTAFGRRSGRGSSDVQARDYVTVPGQRAVVTLVDGTRLTLAPASRLRVPRDYAVGDRTVTLEGEAFFSVVHDAAHPFRVRAARTTATDIGTQFDVRAYAEDARVRVAVADGRVDVARACERDACRHPASAARTLAAGDVAVVDADTVAVARGTDVGALTSWTRGALVFRDAQVADVARELARWYDLDVRVSDAALSRRPLTATLAADSLGAVLSVLELALDARAVRVGRLLTLSPRTAPGALVKRIRRPMS